MIDNLAFRSHLSTFIAENTTQNGSLRPKKMLQRTCYSLRKNFEKNPENDICDFQNGQKLYIKSVKLTKFCTTNFIICNHLSTFPGKNTTKCRPFKLENNVQALPKQLENKFEFVKIVTFFTPKMVKKHFQNCKNHYNFV